MTTQLSDLLIKGGLLVSREGITRSEVLISDGKVEALGTDIPDSKARNVIDAKGPYNLAG